MTQEELRKKLEIPEWAVAVRFTPRRREKRLGWRTLYYLVEDVLGIEEARHEMLSHNYYKMQKEYYYVFYYKRLPKWYWARRAEMVMMGEHKGTGFSVKTIWKKEKEK